MASPQALAQLVRHSLAVPRAALSALHNGTHCLSRSAGPVIHARNYSHGLRSTSCSPCPRMRHFPSFNQRRTMKVAASQEGGSDQTEQKSKQSSDAIQKQQETSSMRSGNGTGAAGGLAVSPLSSVIEELWDPMFPSRFVSPVRSISRMIDAMDRIFDDFSFTPARFSRDMTARTQLRTPFEVQEDDGAYHLRVDMPGLSKDEVKVQIEDGVLSIKGEHSEEKKSDQRFSRTFGTYQTRLALPDDADPKNVSAELKDGVLLVTLTKLPEVQRENAVDVPIN
eukprot:TRINITY_DN22923_c0_g1_i1.p1 TRINITY_DN22923_c0_g1~~TRINITY_DN22923_c0_g1_i1.p1  ORF type:complete len:281 (-),score=35.13 TRINITY_DN22923_c0_g1_i1:992-1834(-)